MQIDPLVAAAEARAEADMFRNRCLVLRQTLHEAEQKALQLAEEVDALRKRHGGDEGGEQPAEKPRRQRLNGGAAAETTA